MNTKSLNALNTLTAQFPEISEAFYAVTMYDSHINLQGNLSAKTLTITKALGVTLSQHPEHLWFDGTTKVNGFRLDFCLTA